MRAAEGLRHSRGTSPLQHGHGCVCVVLLDPSAGPPGGVGHLGRHDADLLEGLAWSAFAVKVDVVDVSGSTVGEHGDEIFRGHSPEAPRHDAGEFPEIVGRYQPFPYVYRANVMERVVGQ